MSEARENVVHWFTSDSFTDPGRAQHDENCAGCVIERLADRVDAYEEALTDIAEQDPVELALDPQWSQRIARAVLAGGRES